MLLLARGRWSIHVMVSETEVVGASSAIEEEEIGEVDIKVLTRLLLILVND